MRSWAAITAICLLLAGCGKHEPEKPIAPPGAVVGQITSEACTFRQFEKQEFAARCGVLYVPENRLKPGSRLIALPYTRVLARAKAPGAPVFALAGGPGQSNMSPGFPVSWFLDRRDVVMIGYRGVDGSVRLDCPQVDSELRRGGSMLDQPGIMRLRKAYEACLATLNDTKVDLAGYTVLEVVDDLEAVRQALGYARIDFAAISYGTRPAMIYGWRYPEMVERSALIDVNPPGRFWLDPALLDKQIRRYAELCAADSACSARTKNLAADIRAALRNMPKRWLGFPIERDTVLVATFVGLYTTKGAASVFDTWIAAAKGDYSGMALITMTFSSMLPPMVYGDGGTKAFSVDFGDGRECNGLEPGRTLIGLPLNAMACAGASTWPQHKIPAEYRTVQPSNVETLMLGGTLDVATPAENAQVLLAVMPRARQVVIAEASHSGDLIYQQPEATRRLLTTFFDSGRADASLFRYHPVNFDPGWMRLPLIAKALVALSLLAVVLLARLVLHIVQRFVRSGAQQ